MAWRPPVYRLDQTVFDAEPRTRPDRGSVIAAARPPAEVLEERDRALSAAQTLGQLLLGEPPVGRSALERARQLAGREFSPAFLLLTPWNGGDR
jgi:hypothetical protein